MQTRLRLVLFTSIMGLSLFAPLATQAYDSRCFTESQCRTIRGFASDEGDFKDFFYTKADAQASCGVSKSGGTMAGGKDENGKSKGEKVGFCLAAGEATTKIGIGGRRNFSDLGQFIKYFYEYGMWIAGILAVAVIIAAGFSWIVSGGNSDSISGAKKKIAGAITGLILLSLSYVILNTINPYLVELRLPKTWMINTAGLTAPFCSEMDGVGLAYLGPDKATISDEEKEKALAAAEAGGYLINPKEEILNEEDKKKIDTINADKTLTPEQKASQISAIKKAAAVANNGSLSAADVAAIKAIEANTALTPLQKVEQMNAVTQAAAAASADYNKSPVCGHRYLVNGTGGQSCLGDICGSGSACVPFTTPPNRTDIPVGQATIPKAEIIKTSACWVGDLVINYRVDDIFQNLINDASGNLVGKLDNDENNHWFQDNAANGGALDTDIWIYPVCQIVPPPADDTTKYHQGDDSIEIKKVLGESPFVIDMGDYLSTRPIILTIERPGTFREYLVRWSNITSDDINTLSNHCLIDPKNNWSAALPIYAKLVGVIVKNQINVSWDTDDQLIYAYKDVEGKGTAEIWTRREIGGVGSFSDQRYFFPKGYIPLADIDGSKKKGLYLDLSLSGDTLQNINQAIDDGGGD